MVIDSRQKKFVMKYATQTMLCQSQAFLAEEKSKFCLAFLIFKKAKYVEKARISKSGFKKAK